MNKYDIFFPDILGQLKVLSACITHSFNVPPFCTVKKGKKRENTSAF